MSALPMAKVKVAIKKQSPTSTAVFLVDVFVSPSSGYRAGCGMRLVDWLSVAAFMVPPMIEPYVAGALASCQVPTGGLLSRPDRLNGPGAERSSGWQRKGQERQEC